MVNDHLSTWYFCIYHPYYHQFNIYSIIYFPLPTVIDYPFLPIACRMSHIAYRISHIAYNFLPLLDSARDQIHYLEASLH